MINGSSAWGLAEVIAHVTCDIDRWQLNFWRNRCFRLYRLFVELVYQECLGTNHTGMSINRDIAPMRISVQQDDFTGESIMFHSVRLFGDDGGCPVQLSQRSRGRRPAIRLDSWIRYGSANYVTKKSEIPIADSSSPNAREFRRCEYIPRHDVYRVLRGDRDDFDPTDKLIASPP